jgi:hypothetical protein
MPEGKRKGKGKSEGLKAEKRNFLIVENGGRLIALPLSPALAARALMRLG